MIPPVSDEDQNDQNNQGVITSTEIDKLKQALNFFIIDRNSIARINFYCELKIIWWVCLIFWNLICFDFFFFEKHLFTNVQDSFH